MSWEMVGTALATYRSILTANVPTNSRHPLENIGDDGVSVQDKLGLEREKSAATEQKHVERTLKTRRSLLRSDFHPAIISLSFLE